MSKDILAGFKKHRAGRIHVLCRQCGRKLSNMPRNDFDDARAVLVSTVCEKHDTGCGGPEEFYYDADGKEIPFDEIEDALDAATPTPTTRRTMAKPRRSVPKQEALVSELHILIQRNTRAALDKARAAHRSVVISGEGPHAYEWEHEAMGQALDNIMEIFGYITTPIQ